MVCGYLVALAIAVCSARALAEEPPHVTYSPVPPGTVVQNQLVYLAGETMHAQWRAVLSKKPVGHNASQTFYQWYLSIYAIDGATYHLKYQSPQDGIPFSRVTQAHGAAMWFPVADASIAGVGELMGPGAQQLVLVSHEAAADCGSSRVDVFFQDAAMQMIMPTLSVRNPCSLSARVIHDAHGTALAISGPYYAPNAALCCPTKNHVTAIFRMVANKGWVQTPKYFEVLKTP